MASLRGLFANPAPVLLAGGSGLADNIRLGFRASTDPWGGKWKPLVVRKGKPLLHTGQLRGSISAKVDGNFAIKVFSGDNPSKSNLHQFGGFTTIKGRRVFVPARPFFPIRNGRADLPAAWRADMVADIVAAVRVKLR
jgi:phage gpG-like protein